MKKLWLVVIDVAVLAVLLVGTVAAQIPWLTMRQAALGRGHLVEMVPLENGDAVVVKADPDQRAFVLVYLQAGTPQPMQSILWGSDTEPAVTVKACTNTIHLVFTAEDGVMQYASWDLPKPVNETYLPLVCLSR